MRYRSKIETISQILSVANGGGVTRTRIMYAAFLNPSKGIEILTTLTHRGLLRYDGKSRTYKTTEKGFRALQACNEICELMKGIEQSKVITRQIVSEVN